MQAVTCIDMLRHGEPEGGRMYRGSGTDHPLSTLGWKQMHESLHQQSGWSVIVSSPMKRCIEFANKIGRDSGIPVLSDASFMEAAYGAWEGKTPDEVKQEFAQAYSDFYADPVHCRPPGAETLASLNERVMSAFSKLLQTYKGQKILLISHAGVMRAVMGNILATPLASQQKIKIPYAGMYQVLEDDKGAQIFLR